MRNAIIIFAVSLFSCCAYSQEINVTFKTVKDSSAAMNYVIDVIYPQADFGPEALMGLRGIAGDINTTLDTMISNQINDFKSAEAETNVKIADATNELVIKSSATNTKGSFLSLLIEIFTYIVGSANPMTTYISFNYSVTAIGVLSIQHLFLTGSNWLNYISDYSIKSLAEQQTKMGVNIDKDWIQRGAGANAENFKCFNISSDTLVITYNAYQVAPYYVGSQRVYIPLASMKEMIDPKGPLGYLWKE
jgi:hypothetical protein